MQFIGTQGIFRILDYINNIHLLLNNFPRNHPVACQHALDICLPVFENVNLTM